MFLDTTLNFGPFFIKWIETPYKNISNSIINLFLKWNLISLK